MITKLFEIINNLTPWTKRLLIICVFVSIIVWIIAAAYTDNLGMVINMLFGEK